MEEILLEVILAILILNATAFGIGLGIWIAKKKLNLDIQKKLKKFDEIAELASNSSQSIARKVAELADQVVVLNMRNGK